MKKQICAAFAMALVGSCLTALPARADDGGLHGIMMIPVRLVAFGAGAVVGTPIAIVRKIAENDKDMANSAAGDDANPLLKGGAMLVTLPFAVFKGGLEGAYWGVSNSWTNSSEKPFSGESFSLGEMK